jgi:DNA-binding XRE family transcriptional regulator
MEVERYLHEIATRIRRWRGEERLTLQQAAQRSGVAASTIQKVESQQMVPTITVLFKIARGLGRSPVDLLESVASEPDHVVRSGAADGDDPVVSLTGGLSAAQLSGWRVVLAPGESGQAAEPATGGEFLLLSERGRLEVVRGAETFTLEPGDSIHCKSEETLSWRSLGDEVASFSLISAGTEPSTPRVRRFSGAADAPAVGKPRRRGGPSSAPV